MPASLVIRRHSRPLPAAPLVEDITGSLLHAPFTCSLRAPTLQTVRTVLDILEVADVDSQTSAVDNSKVRWRVVL